MKIDLNQTINDLRGKPIREKDEETGVTSSLTLKYCLIEALGRPLAGDDTVSGQKKLDITLLGLKVNSGDHDLTAEDISLIKDRVSKLFSPVVSGRCWMLLEQMDNPYEVKK